VSSSASQLFQHRLWLTESSHRRRNNSNYFVLFAFPFFAFVAFFIFIAFFALTGFLALMLFAFAFALTFVGFGPALTGLGFKPASIFRLSDHQDITGAMDFLIIFAIVSPLLEM
jgi:hypothetical protein